MEKKPIRSSNLNLRFYVNDGWTKKELEEILEKGSILGQFAEEENGYYILDVGSRFHINKLLEKMSVLHRTFNDYPQETDEEFIEGRMW